MDALDPIEEGILECLQLLEQDWSSWDPTDPQATCALKDAIGSVGEKLRYRVYANGCRFGSNGEWLFDMTWLQVLQLDDDEYIASAPLALECEWTPGEIWDDFEKLLLARAEHRVFVYWASSISKARQTAEDLLELVGRFGPSRAGDRYLLACWVDETERFDTTLHVVSSVPSAIPPGALTPSAQ